MKRFAPERLLLLLVSAQLAIGIVDLTLGLGSSVVHGSFTVALEAPGLDGVVPPGFNGLKRIVYLFQMAAFGAAGGLLVLGSKRDQRALYLGGAFLIIGSAFIRHQQAGLGQYLPVELWRLAVVLASMPMVAFLAAYLWLFARDFPSVPISFRAQRRQALGVRLAWIAGLVVFVPQLVTNATETLAGRAEAPAYKPFLSVARFSFAATLLLLLAAVVLMAWKVTRAHGEEHRRSRMFLGALLVAIGPLTVEMVAEALIPAYYAFLRSHQTFLGCRFLGYHLLLLSVPFTTAYAVRVHGVLEVSLIARRMLRYALARWSTMAVVLLPFALVVAYLYRSRNQPLAEALSGRQVIVLGLLLLAGTLGLLFRRRLLDSIDRRFFRERYNARLILTRLVDQIRGLRNVRELANLVARGVDLALHLERVSLLAEDPIRGQLIDPRGAVRPLDMDSRLVTLMQSAREPLEVDFDLETSAVRELPEAQRHWLVDAKARMLVPAFASDGALIGLIVLGAKKSEIPFLREDRQLLTAISASAGLSIELLRLKARTPTPEAAAAGAERPPHAPANGGLEKGMECLRCDRVYAPEAETCAHCRQGLEPSVVPHVLPRRFRFEKRIGTGGMAVVYRARDLALGRTVAIKTLPRVSPEAAMRLHREARAAASVSHPGLAAIYGIETWEGMPMLILELLDGGTLADRIVRGPLAPQEIIRTGQAVARALDTIHGVGILHRDIKPSNIGYTRDGEAKLLDFGIARIASDLRHEPNLRHPSTNALTTVSWFGFGEDPTETGQIVGTLSYLSPEALAGAKADPSFDLWSLSVVLYEALTGENLFYGPNLVDLLDRIRSADVPDLRERLPQCPAPLAAFFRRALHRDPQRRPANGEAYDRALAAVQRAVQDEKAENEG